MSRRRKPSRRSTARRTSETADRTPAVRPVAAPSGSNREAATAWPAATAPAEWTDVRRPRKAPKTPRRDQTAPRWSAVASPAKDASSGSAPRCRRRRTTPRSSDPRLASIPRDSLRQPKESYEKTKHQQLLGRLFQHPARRAERLAGDAMPRAVGIDAARLTSWHGRRRPGGRSAALD